MDEETDNTANQSEKISLENLIDISLCSPEPGSVNFNILRTLLKTMVRSLSLDHVVIDRRDIDDIKLSEELSDTDQNSNPSPDLKKMNVMKNGKIKIPFERSNIRKQSEKRRSMKKQLNELTEKMKVLDNIKNLPQIMKILTGDLQDQSQTSGLLRMATNISDAQDRLCELAEKLEDLRRNARQNVSMFYSDGTSITLEDVHNQYREVQAFMKHFVQPLTGIPGIFGRKQEKISSFIPKINEDSEGQSTDDNEEEIKETRRISQRKLTAYEYPLAPEQFESSSEETLTDSENKSIDIEINPSITTEKTAEEEKTLNIEETQIGMQLKGQANTISEEISDDSVSERSRHKKEYSRPTSQHSNMKKTNRPKQIVKKHLQFEVNPPKIKLENNEPPIELRAKMESDRQNSNKKWSKSSLEKSPKYQTRVGEKPRRPTDSMKTLRDMTGGLVTWRNLARVFRTLEYRLDAYVAGNFRSESLISEDSESSDEDEMTESERRIQKTLHRINTIVGQLMSFKHNLSNHNGNSHETKNDGAKLNNDAPHRQSSSVQTIDGFDFDNWKTVNLNNLNGKNELTSDLLQQNKNKLGQLEEVVTTQAEQVRDFAGAISQQILTIVQRIHKFENENKSPRPRRGIVIKQGQTTAEEINDIYDRLEWINDEIVLLKTTKKEETVSMFDLAKKVKLLDEEQNTLKQCKLDTQVFDEVIDKKADLEIVNKKLDEWKFEQALSEINHELVNLFDNIKQLEVSKQLKNEEIQCVLDRKMERIEMVPFKEHVFGRLREVNAKLSRLMNELDSSDAGATTRHLAHNTDCLSCGNRQHFIGDYQPNRHGTKTRPCLNHLSKISQADENISGQPNRNNAVYNIAANQERKRDELHQKRSASYGVTENFDQEKNISTARKMIKKTIHEASLYCQSDPSKAYNNFKVEDSIKIEKVDMTL